MSATAAASGGGKKGGGGGGGSEEGVKVFCRVRPFNKREIEISKKQGLDVPESVINMTETTCTVLEHYRDEKGFSQTKEREAFSFDECFWTMLPGQGDSMNRFADQQYVYEKVGRPALTAAYEGYNSTIFAYGQTGSGKTYSMLGSPDDQGIIIRLIEELFARYEAIQKTTPTLKLLVETMFYEVYNEKCRDLYNKKGKSDDYDAPKIRQHPTKGTYVEGLLRKECKNAEDACASLDKGMKERAMSATKMNATSSRSHAIFLLQLTQSDAMKGTQKTAVMNLVDLAGSEKVRDSGVTGEGFQEAKNINLSLSTLRKVIDCLIDNATAKKKKVPPYRESVLTYVLSDSLGGNSKTTMLSAISPHEVNTEDTLNTLRYALRAKAIVCNASVNEEKSAKMMDAMKDELRKLREALSKGETPPGYEGGGGEGAGGRPMMPEEIKAEIEQREQEMVKMEKEQEALQELLGQAKKREEEAQKQLEEVAEQRAALDIQVEQKKREQFASAFRSAFLITKDKRRHEENVKELDEAKTARLDAEETAERAKTQLEDVKSTCDKRVSELEKELADSEEKLKQVFSENKDEREKLRKTLQSRVNQLEGELATNQEIIETIRKETEDEVLEIKARLKSQITELKKELAHVKSDSESAEADAKSNLEREKRVSAERLSDIEARLNEARDDAAKNRSDARAARDSAREQGQEMLKQIAALQREIEEASDSKANDIREATEQHSRKSSQLSLRVSELEKELSNAKERHRKFEYEAETAAENKQRAHTHEVNELKQQHDTAARLASQALTDAQREVSNLKQEVDAQNTEHERNLAFERNLREESLRDIKSSSERAKSQLNRRITELEVELQTEKSSAEQSLQSAKNSAHEEISSRDRTISDLRAECKKNESRIEQIQMEKEAALREQAEAGGNKKSAAALEESQSRISSLEQQLRETKESNSQLQSQLDFRTKQFDSEVAELTSLNEEIRRDSKKFLDAQLGELQSRITEAHSQLDSERSRHREALAQKERSLHEKVSLLAELEREVSSTRDSRASLEEDLRHARTQLEQQQREHQSKLEELAHEASELQRGKNESDAKAMEAQKSARSNVAKMSELERELQVSQASLEKRDYQLKQIQDKLNEEHGSEMTELKAELARSEEALRRAESQVRVLQGAASQHARVESQLNQKLEESQTQNAKLHAQLSSGQDKLVSELRQKIAQHRDEAESIRSSMEQLEQAQRHDNANREKRVIELQNDVSIAKQSLQLFETESARRLSLIETSMQARTIALESELRVVRESLRNSEREARTAASENESLQRKMSELAQNLDKERERRESDIEAATNSASASANTARTHFEEQKKNLVKELESVRQQLVEVECDKKKTLEEVSTNHRSEIFNLKQSLSVSNNEVESLQSKLSETQRDLIQQQQDHDRTVSEIRSNLFSASSSTSSSSPSSSASPLSPSASASSSDSNQQRNLHQQQQEGESAKTLRIRELEEALKLSSDSFDSLRRESKESIERVKDQNASRLAELEKNLKEAHEETEAASKQEASKIQHLKSLHQQTITSLEQRISNLQTERDRVEREATERVKNQTSQRIHELENQLRSTTAEFSDAQRSSKSTFEKIQQQSQRRIEQLEDDLRSATSSKENSVTSAVAKARDEHDRAVSRLESDLRELRTERDRLKDQAEKAHNLENAARDSTSRISSLEHQLLEAEAARDSMTSAHQAELQRIKVQHQAVESDLRSQLEQATESEQSLRRQVTEKSNSQHEQLQARVAQLESSLHDTQEALRRSQSERLQEVDSIRSRYQDQVTKLEAEVSAGLASREADTRSFKEKLRLMNEEHRQQLERESQASKQLVESTIFNSKMSQQNNERATKARINELEHENSEALKELAVARSKIDALTSSANRANQRANLAEDTLANIKKQQDSLAAEITALKVARNELAATHEAKVEEMGSQLAREEAAHRQSVSEASAESQKRQQHFSEREAALQSGLRTAQDALESARKESKAALDRVRQVSEARILELEEEINDRNNNISRLQQEHSAQLNSLEETYHNKLKEVRDSAISSSSSGSGSNNSPFSSSSSSSSPHHHRNSDNNVNIEHILELENQIRSLQLTGEQARQGRDVAERQLSLEQNRIVTLEANLNAEQMKKDMLDADMQALKTAHAKQISQLQSHSSSLESEVAATRQSLDRITRELNVEREHLTEGHDKAKELGHKLHMSELKLRETSDELGQERVTHEQKIGELERKIQELLFERDRLERSHTEAVDRIRTQCERRVHEVEVSLINATNLSQGSTEQQELERLREQNSHSQLRITELEKEVSLGKTSSARAEHDFSETYERVKEQANKRVHELEREISSLRQSLTAAQRESKEALDRQSAQSEKRVAELERELQSSNTTQLSVREEAKINSDRLLRQHQVQHSELEQKLQHAAAASEALTADLSLAQMLKQQNEKRASELEAEVRRLTEALDRTKEEKGQEVERAREMQKQDKADLEKQLAIEKQLRAETSRELTTSRERVASNMQLRVSELEKLLHQATERASSSNNELESVKRAYEMQKAQYEMRANELTSKLSNANDEISRSKLQLKDTMDKMNQQHSLRVQEAERKSPATRHADQVSDMEARMRAREVQFANAERNLRDRYEQEIASKSQHEMQLEAENKQLKAAVSQLQSAGNSERKRLGLLEREARIQGLDPAAVVSGPAAASGVAGAGDFYSPPSMSALDAARQRHRHEVLLASANSTAKGQQQLQHQIKKLSSSSDGNNGGGGDNNNNNSGLNLTSWAGGSLEISHMFANQGIHRQQQQQQQQPSSTSSQNQQHQQQGQRRM